MTEEKELTVAEVAARLGVNYRTALKRIHMKRIRARAEGTGFRVKESDLQAYIRSTYNLPEQD